VTANIKGAHWDYIRDVISQAFNYSTTKGKDIIVLPLHQNKKAFSVERPLSRSQVLLLKSNNSPCSPQSGTSCCSLSAKYTNFLVIHFFIDLLLFVPSYCNLLAKKLRKKWCETVFATRCDADSGVVEADKLLTVAGRTGELIYYPMGYYVIESPYELQWKDHLPFTLQFIVSAEMAAILV
jgi:hypothetical protein